MTTRIQPYGSWPSHVSADAVAAGSVGLGGLCVDRGDFYWSELRSADGGRNVIVRYCDGKIDDVLPSPYSARSRVNEYGGGAFTVADGVIFFTNNADQRIYRLPPAAAPVAITPADARRYADLIVDRERARLIAVCEDHRADGEPTQSIVAVDTSGVAEPVTLASGHDFYAAPRLSPDGRMLAFIAWDHPNMPWDGTLLYRGTIRADGVLETAARVAGGPTESIVQPTFAPNNDLYFISDRSGWWNMYRLRGTVVDPVRGQTAEFSPPFWVFGLSTYTFLTNERLVAGYNERGSWRLAELNLRTGESRDLPLPHCDIAGVCANGERVAFIGASATEPSSVVAFDLQTNATQTLRRSTALALDTAGLSIGEAIDFATEDGERAHAFFYRPRHAEVAGSPAERPPLLVMSHGGPTAATSPALNLKIQYWTSRGFAVLDVNYRGSSGYGRVYRERLYGCWGVADVEDCIAGARFLVERGEVDGERLAIRGSSAGGYTTLCALTFHRLFRAGASHYGISDLELLAHDTHKFEARYLDRLIGPYPQARDLYRSRSPIHYAEQLNCPVIFFQGEEDRVVPPNQTERLVDALRRRNILVAYLLFPGEQHGFRRAENIVRALETELRFYGRVFGFATDVDARVPDPLGPGVS